MLIKKATLILVVGVISMMALSSLGFATQVPYEDSEVRYFYVFGQDGDPLMGAEDSELEVVIDVPADCPNDVVIGVFDPNTGGTIDWKKPDSEWNTTTEFSVYGAKMLDSEKFGETEYDGTYYDFGPYPKTSGEKKGNFYRFRLVAKGLEGNDQNLFKVMVKPNSAEVYSESITFRLLPHKGDKMYFYPEVPAGTSSVIVRNYDLDVDGGMSTLQVSALSHKTKIKDSESGEWAETSVSVESETGGRLYYIITKATQKHANAGLEVTDAGGKKLPIYFRKSTPPLTKAVAPAPKAKPKAKPAPVKKPDLKCNKFTFDATHSYDVDKQDLSYLWDFGDGETSTDAVVTHIYEKGGEYTVSLKVTDSSGLPCDSGATSQKIYVNTPPVAAYSAPALVCAKDTVTFDASATRDDTPGNLSYLWSFGDGAHESGKKTSHTYDRGGKYNVTLTVDDNSGTACAIDSIQKSIKVNTAPVAVAGKDITMCLKSLSDEYAVVLNGSSSKDADGDNLTYTWNLGDGTTTEGAKVTHVYQKGGVYKVTLNVDDGSGLACSSDTDSLSVNLNKAPVAVAGSNKKVCTGQSVTFDGSASKTEAGETLSYEWSFGDGEKATGETVSHTYTRGGKHTAVLTVDDGRGTHCSISTDVVSVDVNSRPTAELAKVKDTCVGKKVNLDASASRDPDGDKLSYTWNFGDGTTTEGSSRVSHVYTKGGTYNVSVTVDDGQDSPCSGASDSIRVNVNTPPDAMMDVTKACCVDMEQKFSATSSKDPDGDKLSYFWDFGDGQTAEGANVTHTYTEPGNYKVFLKVDDGSGTECSAAYAAEFIKVNAKPVPVIKIR
ncbi:PKD domain-containing protein [Candidatus Omnitrophota bacterium]